METYYEHGKQQIEESYRENHARQETVYLTHTYTPIKERKRRGITVTANTNRKHLFDIF